MIRRVCLTPPISIHIYPPTDSKAAAASSPLPPRTLSLKEIILLPSPTPAPVIVDVEGKGEGMDVDGTGGEGEEERLLHALAHTFKGGEMEGLEVSCHYHSSSSPSPLSIAPLARALPLARGLRRLDLGSSCGGGGEGGGGQQPCFLSLGDVREVSKKRARDCVGWIMPCDLRWFPV